MPQGNPDARRLPTQQDRQRPNQSSLEVVCAGDDRREMGLFRVEVIMEPVASTSVAWP